jgi:hypothetical protein
MRDDEPPQKAKHALVLVTPFYNLDEKRIQDDLYNWAHLPDSPVIRGAIGRAMQQLQYLHCLESTIKTFRGPIVIFDDEEQVKRTMEQYCRHRDQGLTTVIPMDFDIVRPKELSWKDTVGFLDSLSRKRVLIGGGYLWGYPESPIENYGGSLGCVLRKLHENGLRYKVLDNLIFQ